MNSFAWSWLIFAVWLNQSAGEVGVFYVGELAPGRHFVYASNNTAMGSRATMEYFRDSWERCRDLGGRLAWLDTAELLDAAQAWLALRFDALYDNYFCRRGKDGGGGWCGFPLGFFRAGGTADVVGESVWTTDMDSPKGAGSTWKTLDADRAGVAAKVNVQNDHPSHVLGGLTFDGNTGTASLSYTNRNGGAGLVNHWMQERGWNALCEVPQAPRSGVDEELGFRRDATTAPPFPLATVDLGGGRAARMRCAQKCFARRACMAFAVEEAGERCRLYDWLPEDRGTVPATLYQIIHKH